jgi:hypothetical protein
MKEVGPSPSTSAGSGRVARFSSKRCYFQSPKTRLEAKAAFRVHKLQSRLGNFFVRVPVVCERSLGLDPRLAGKLVRLREDNDVQSEAAEIEAGVALLRHSLLQELALQFQ